MINKLFKNKDIKVIILEVFLIVLGLVGLTLGVKYIMNSINVNIDTSKLAIDSMNANVTNGTLMPINDSTVNINTTSNVLRITFDVKGASTNTGNNIIYDVLLNLTADCSLKNESIKWNLYKNNNLLTSGTTSPKYDKNVLGGKITLTDTQQDLVPYSKTADKYVFILWMSESCNEEDITKCDLSKSLTSDSGGKSISGNIDIRLNSGKKKENKRESSNIENTCSILGGNAAEAVKLADDGTTGDSGSGVYKIEHNAIPSNESATGSEIPAVTDYRYYGPEPNNYILLPDMNTIDNTSCIVNGHEVEDMYGSEGKKMPSNIDCESQEIYKFDLGSNGIHYFPLSLFEIIAPAGSVTFDEDSKKCTYGGNVVNNITYSGSFEINKDTCLQISLIKLTNGYITGVFMTKVNEKPHILKSINGLYRIIGSVYNELEKTNVLKVIKAYPITDGTTDEFIWDYTSSGSRSNIWATPTSGRYSNSLDSGASLMTLLNSGAWWNGTSGSYYNYSNSTTAINVDFTNYGLSENAKKQIITSKYYLGGWNTSAVKTGEMYKYERGTTTYGTDNSSPLSWDGYVGLMYPSDYGYAAGNSCTSGTNLISYNKGCQQKDWLYSSVTNQWLMSPHSGSSNIAWDVYYIGYVRSDYVNIRRAVRPVFSLSPNTTISSGTGTIDDPYILSSN